jgi:hypothetical protein
MPEPTRRAMGARGRAWVLDHFDSETVAAQALQVYEAAGGGDKAPDRAPQAKQN